MRHPRERQHTRGRRRQRIPQRVVQLGRRAMRWHVVVLTVCAASFSFLCCCVVCWRRARNVFGLGLGASLFCCCFLFCEVRVLVSSTLCLFACDRELWKSYFRKRAPPPITSHAMSDAHLRRPYYTLKTSDRSNKRHGLSCAVAQEKRKNLKSFQEKL